MAMVTYYLFTFLTQLCSWFQCYYIHVRIWHVSVSGLSYKEFINILHLSGSYITGVGLHLKLKYVKKIHKNNL